MRDTGSMLEVVDVNNNKLQEPEHMGMSMVGAGMGLPTMNFSMGFLLPYIALMGGALPSHGMPGMGSPFGGSGRREVVKTRECALSECNIYFTPEKRSQSCCSKEHFFILKNIQKEKNKIIKVHRKKKRKKK